MFEFLLTALAFIAGAVASVAGFGIGSLLTPFLTVKYGANLAIAAVSIAHFLGTLLRFVYLRPYIDKKALIHFGILSAAGGLTGACLHAFITSPAMSVILGIILIFAGSLGLSGLSEKIKLKGRAAWIAGALSGIFGGLVGNQGGIRSAALLGFDLSKQAYVATATAIGLMVDISRMPVYFLIERERLVPMGLLIAFMSAGVLAGTLMGTRILSWIPEKTFKRCVSGIVILLGLFTLLQAYTGRLSQG